MSAQDPRNAAFKVKDAAWDNDAWATPWDIFNYLNLKYDFTLDVCANAENHKVARYFTKEMNGLAQAWAPERCWMNPPYSEVDLWLKKAYIESRLGALVVAFVKADTSTRWWRDFIPAQWLQPGADPHGPRADDGWFWPRRVKFIPPPGYTKPGGGLNMGSAVLIFGGPNI